MAESVCVATASTTAAVLLRGAEQDVYRIAAAGSPEGFDTRDLIEAKALLADLA